MDNKIRDPKTNKIHHSRDGFNEKELGVNAYKNRVIQISILCTLLKMKINSMSLMMMTIIIQG